MLLPISITPEYECCQESSITLKCAGGINSPQYSLLTKPIYRPKNSHLSANVQKAHFVVRISHLVSRTTPKDTECCSLKVAIPYYSPFSLKKWKFLGKIGKKAKKT